MNTIAVVLEGPQRLALAPVELLPPGDDDVVVDIEWSGISTGTERLLWSGRMPAFPGMGYPLVPGYESVGRIRAAGPAAAGRRVGDRVFVPGSRGFSNVRGLFGGAAARVVLPAARTIPVAESLGEEAVLLALAATAQHAIAGGPVPPDLVVGHGVLGRLLARLIVAAGHPAPTVWETNPDRQGGADGYRVCHPDADERRDYRAICDVSGDAKILDQLIARLAPGGEVILAGFYSELSFQFAPAFMREARLRVAAEWREADLTRVLELLDAGQLSLAGLITHREPARAADAAYRTAFGDPACLKMILDWRSVA
jgi:3-hydroxyethyl bacteriochlorophyllide a dehydrogenase